jgi:VanW like protein
MKLLNRIIAVAIVIGVASAGYGVVIVVGKYRRDNAPQAPGSAFVTLPVSAPPPSASAPPKPVERLVGRFSSLFKTAEKDERVHNITLGASKLDEAVLKPGEDWSFNTTVGRRTKETGFKEAPVLIMGEVFQDVGGGMCQVSSTLHAVAVKTGIEIVRRQPHSRPSSYIPRGLDATVNYPESCWEGKQDPNVCFDLRLRNPYDFDLTIRTKTVEWDADKEKLPKNLRPHGPHQRLVVELWGIGPVARVDTKWKLYATPEPKRRWRKGWKSGTWSKKKQNGRQGVRGALVMDTTWPDGRKTHSITISNYRPVDEVWWVGRDWEGGDPWE